MTKRGKGEGSIYQRGDKRWSAQITLPSGKRQTYYGKTRKEVVARLDEAKALLKRGLPLPSERQTVADYMRGWLASVTTIRATTKARYAQDVERIARAFPTTPLVRLSAQQVQTFYGKLAEGLSSTTVHHTHAVLHRALSDALRMDLVSQNVADKVDAPRRDHHEMTTLGEEQGRILLEMAKESRYQALFVLALATGMRRGELLALKWQDVDLDKGVLSVRASVQILDGAPDRLIIAETKTAHSRRQVSLGKRVIDALRAHKAAQKAERFHVGPGVWVEHDLVFPGYRGGILDPQRPGKTLNQLLRAANLPPMRFHDLRHTAISLMLARGVQPHTVAKLVGDDVGLMLRVYAHVSPNQEKEAAAVMDAVFGG